MSTIDTAVAAYRPTTAHLVETAKRMKVKKYEDVMDAADFLLEVKTLGESITSRKEEITKPLNESLKSARALFKPLETQCADAEAAVKSAVLDYHYKNWNKNKDTDNTVRGTRGKLTVVEREQANILDPKAIPLQFCSPDPEKILHALKAGIAVEGAELIKTYSIAAGKN